MSQEPPFQLPNFELQRLLGKGGMASVWLARQISLDRPVAIKILSPEFSTQPEDIQQFRREAQFAGCLRHPGIVEIYDANCSNGFYYFVMEFVNGYTMREYLRRKKMLELEDVLAIGESVAIAMDYAWTQYGLVHCDIKPDNIMVDADGTVKVTDLGLCKSLFLSKDSPKRIQENEDDSELYGTPAYMSPEQIYGTETLDSRSDIYELGATMYHLLTGRMLFQGKSDEDMIRCHVGEDQGPDPRKINRMISLNVVLLLQKMLAKDRRYRQKDWRALLDDFLRIRENKKPWPTRIPPKGSSIELE